MKITKEELTRLLAEKVMGWVNDREYGYGGDAGYRSKCLKKFYCFVHKWNPLEDERHALQVLEAFMKSNPDASWEEVLYWVGERIEDGQTFCCAVCSLVAEAVTGNKYELED